MNCKKKDVLLAHTNKCIVWRIHFPMSMLVCVAILQCRVYDIAMVTAVYLHLNHKKSYLEREITLLRQVLWANLVTLIGTCKHLEREINIPAGVFATFLCILCIHSFRGTRPESRNAIDSLFLVCTCWTCKVEQTWRWQKLFHFHWWNRIFLTPLSFHILWIIPDQLASKMKYSSLCCTCLCISGMLS